MDSDEFEFYSSSDELLSDIEFDDSLIIKVDLLKNPINNTNKK